MTRVPMILSALIRQSHAVFSLNIRTPLNHTIFEHLNTSISLPIDVQNTIE